MVPRMKSRRLRIALVVLALAGAWFVPWVFVLHLGVLVYFPYRPDGRTRYVRVTGPVAAMFGADWTPREAIPRAMFAAAVGAEDARFYEHSGIDWKSVRLSLKVNERSGRVKRGGSTITQQLVKNAFLSRRRSYLRKAREAIGALLLDRIMAKETQLAWYLNVIEFGPNVYGIESAARHYFHKSARNLTPAECIELAVIIPRPNRWNRSIVTGQYTRFFRNRYRVVCERIRILGLLGQNDLRLARVAAPFPVGRAPRAPGEALPEFEAPPPEEAAATEGDAGAVMPEATASDSVQAPTGEAPEPTGGESPPPAGATPVPGG